jgi:cysteine synthase
VRGIHDASLAGRPTRAAFLPAPRPSGQYAPVGSALPLSQGTRRVPTCGCGSPRVLYAKAEQPNPAGSIKNRIALHILRQAGREGRIKPGDQIAEATSGNTGIAFAAFGRALGYEAIGRVCSVCERAIIEAAHCA